MEMVIPCKEYRFQILELLTTIGANKMEIIEMIWLDLERDPDYNNNMLESKFTNHGFDSLTGILYSGIMAPLAIYSSVSVLACCNEEF